MLGLAGRKRGHLSTTERANLVTFNTTGSSLYLQLNQQTANYEPRRAGENTDEAGNDEDEPEDMETDQPGRATARAPMPSGRRIAFEMG